MNVCNLHVVAVLLSSLVNELTLTARKMYADEAKSSGLVRYRNCLNLHDMGSVGSSYLHDETSVAGEMNMKRRRNSLSGAHHPNIM